MKKVSIEVKNKREAEAVKRAMADEAIHTTVVVCGALLQLSSDRARARVLNFVADHLDEEKTTVWTQGREGPERKSL
jgi:hypothetical protein